MDEDQTRGHEPIRGIQAFSPGLRTVWWPTKFKPGPIESYDGSTNPVEFLQIYTTTIEAAGGDEKVMANYLPTVLKGSARTWLVNLRKGSIYSWEELCDVFQGNFQGTYKRPQKKQDLYHIAQLEKETLREYIERFWKA